MNICIDRKLQMNNQVERLRKKIMINSSRIMQKISGK